MGVGSGWVWLDLPEGKRHSRASTRARRHDDPRQRTFPRGHDVRCSGGKPMTFDQCQTNLLAIRRRQGTRCPVVKVAYNGMIYQGRLTRADSDPEFRRASESPYGVLVLENLGLG